jgi:predicted enzyme related to lactoylglutathione lyase
MSTTSEGCPTKAAHGTFCWNERLCWDVERAKKFYADAIGWTFTSMPTPTGETYWCAMQDGRPVAGLFTLTSPYFDGVPEGWMSYLAVDDVDRRVAKSDSRGCKAVAADLRRPERRTHRNPRRARRRRRRLDDAGGVTPSTNFKP